MTSTTRPGSKPLELSKRERLALILALFSIFCIGLLAWFILVLKFPVLDRVFTAGMAAVFIASAVWLIVRQKRLSVLVVLLALSGLLFIFDASIRDTYAIMIDPLPGEVRDTIWMAIDIKRVSDGVGGIASGLIWFGIAWMRFQTWRKDKQPNGNSEKVLTLLLSGLFTWFAISRMIEAILDIANGMRW